MMVNTREQTRDSYLERINRVISFIQDHLDEEISLEIIASEACLSSFHFHRIFTAFTGESPGGYIQRLRLERAAFRLARGTDEITRIALDVGYETPAALSRAFRKRFRCSPVEFRRRRLPVPSSSVIILKKENVSVKPEYRTIEDIHVIYAGKKGAYSESTCSAWKTICSFAYSQKLINKESKMIGISYDDPTITVEEKLRYEACISVDRAISPKGEVGVKTIPGGTYAVFLHKGPYENFMKTYAAIFSEWLPSSGVTLRDFPCFELYLNRDPQRTRPENLRTEIFIPVSREQAEYRVGGGGEPPSSHTTVRAGRHTAVHKDSQCIR